MARFLVFAPFMDQRRMTFISNTRTSLVNLVIGEA